MCYIAFLFCRYHGNRHAKEKVSGWQRSVHFGLRLGFELVVMVTVAGAFHRALRLEDWRSGAELDAMLQQQQHLAEDILHLARNLRKSTLASQRLLPHDTQVLSCRAKQDVCEKKWAESEPRYLLWLGLVLVTFISTILFIRLFPELW